MIAWWHGSQRQDALPREHVGEAIRAGGRYVAASPVLRIILLRAGLFIFFAASIWALLPLIAQRQLHLGSGGYGLLLGCVGVGAVGGAALLPRLRSKLTPGGSLGRHRSTCLIPWADIREVVLWRQPMPYGRSVPYVGVARGKGAQPLAGRRGQRAAGVTARALTPGLSGDTLLARRAVNLWRLDAHRMAAAVAHFAPGVRVIDQDTGRVIGPAD